MPTAEVFNMKGESVGSIELPEAVFGAKENGALVHSAIKAYLANQRQGTQSTLTRSEVSGGGKKPWRQKGTGRARQGSIRAPQWIHGGIALGPKPRDYRMAFNKKARRAALRSALSSKAASGEIIVVDEIAVGEYKTKIVVNMLSALKAGKKPMIVTGTRSAELIESASNIPGVVTSIADSINVYDVLNCGKLVFSKAALGTIGEVYA